MMQQPVLIVEAEQQRADKRAAFVVAKAADHAVGAAVVLDLLHAAAIARAVRKIVQGTQTDPSEWAWPHSDWYMCRDRLLRP